VTELSLFPLSAVLLPFGRMPLQIFEPRYLDLVRECLKSGDPFGVVWIRRGAEVAQRGAAAPELGDYGTTARIVDWDRLANGLLGITVAGGQRFDLRGTGARANGLVVGEVQVRTPPTPAPLAPRWRPLAALLRSLEKHPHVRRLALQVDYDDAWQVGYTLLQLLPLEEFIKYRLLGGDSVEALMVELTGLVNRLSGEQ
jgi:Lon protease-like protein